jgi:proteasome activator subunit 4
VLALRALVMSSPYDVPSWMSPVLMALVRVATEKGAVGKTVTSTLSDFRRTHEETLDSVKTTLSEEEWEMIRDVAGGNCSYII